jgi:RNA polymerase sigma factor (TIGR02999 family)
MDEISEWVARVNAGEAGARDRLFAAAYGELRKLAHSRLRDGGRSTVLDTTSLVHETYLRFVGVGPLRSDERRGFLAYAAQVMRSVIVDAVRERRTERRGGGHVELTLNTDMLDGLSAGEDEILKVDEALQALARDEPRLAQVTEMRYFGGFSEQEIASVLDLTERTVRRDWVKARLLLQTLLAG